MLLMTPFALRWKNSSHPNVPKIYDLVGPILKRRKAAVYNLLPEIRNRFGHLYGNSDTGLLTAWINECSALNHSVDGVDHLYYITPGRCDLYAG